MKQIILAIILIISLVNCKGHYQNAVVAAAKIQYDLSHSSLNDSNQFYFPVKLFEVDSGKNWLDTFLVKWYSAQLFALREPLIFADSSGKEIYRFTWLRTFHNPIAIRIEKKGDTVNLYWKLCNGEGGYAPGKLILDKQKSIDIHIWNEFISRLNKVDFWNLTTKEQSFGVDGSEWILEGKNIKHYHVVDIWSPIANSAYYDCCDFLIGQTDLHISEEQKY